MVTMNNLTIADKRELAAFKRAYNKAVKDSKNEFEFKDHILLTQFAKYMIQYIETLPGFNNKYSIT